VSDIPVLIDARLTACWYSYPFQAGWIDAPEVEVIRDPHPTTIRDRNAIALVDSLAATRLLETHVIVADHAVASRRASFLTVVTHTRPDEVDRVTVSTRDISLVGRGVAEATLPRFYGITAIEWTDERREVNEDTIVITEEAEALIPVDDTEHYQEDLGRAWFLLTDTPYVSHICVAPRSALTSDPTAVIAAVERLEQARQVSNDRARELRRNVAGNLEIERDLFTETLADQTYHLDDPERSGFLGLWKHLGVETPRNMSDRIVTLGGAS
jgi:predicted solute-binding protein